MQKYFAASTIVLLVTMVVIRILQLRQQGITAVKFGALDKTDFLIPPFALFYFYLIFANTFGLPTFPGQVLFHSELVAWIGVLLCLAGLGLILGSLISFRRSFRVGIDIDQPDRLITTGVFSLSRNPIYTAFGTVVLAQFLIFPSWILLVYMIPAGWLFHRQVLREEAFLRKNYGREYTEYCQRVRRYL